MICFIIKVFSSTNAFLLEINLQDLLTRNIAEILLKLALKTINLFLISFNWAMRCHIHLLWAPKGIKLVKNGVLSLVLNISPLLASLLAC
jgi:hypothetical protein